MSRSNDKTRKALVAKGHAGTERDHTKSDEFHLYEVVGDKLVNTALTQILLQRHGEKGLPYRTVLSIPEICGENFFDMLDDGERAAIGECLVKLIDTGRIQIHPPKEHQD